jgi:putative chitinase
MITKQQILKATKCDSKNLDLHYDSIMLTLEKYDINSKERIAAFLANAIHETGGLRAFEENLNYSEKGLLATFSRRITKEEAVELARKPEQIANKVYGGRNGNKDVGDGWKYRGRGIFQTTFKDNYSKVSKALGKDFVNNPELLSKPPYAALSAGVYWNSNNLNVLADKGDILGITKKINGGTNGLEDRIKYYVALLKELE